MNPITNIALFRLCLWGFAIACILAVVLSHIIGGRRQKKLERELSEKYPLIYRVKCLPSEAQCVLKAEGTSIKIGDFGWQAEPFRQDSLVYLHGLNDRWQVVWYAGFRPEQVEVVGPKPRTQYYIFPYWVNEQKIPPCQFPVKTFQHGKYPTHHLGFPVQLRGNWVQGKRMASRPASSF